MIVGITTIDQQITLLQIGGDLIDHRIHSRTGFDHHQDPARTFQLADEVLQIGSALNVLALAATVEELFSFGVGPVVDNA